MFSAYNRYPFPIPLRVKIFNVFRYWFKFYPLEQFLIARLSQNKLGFWKRLIPPVYFYNTNSLRYAERDGIRFNLNVSKLIDHSIYFFRIHEIGWENLFNVLQPHFNVIDAGANMGYLSLNFARRCHEGTVYSFEPDSTNFSDLQKNVALNDLENIQLFKKALGQNPGSAELYKMFVNNPGANRILSTAPAHTVPHETVEIITLDQLYASGVFKKIDVIKLDVEGFELFVLKGATQLIKQWKPILFVELSEGNLRKQNCSGLELIEFIENLGYGILDARTMREVDRSFTDHHTDLLCTYKLRGT